MKEKYIQLNNGFGLESKLKINKNVINEDFCNKIVEMNKDKTKDER